jgi:hypothetical protein
MRKNGKNRFCKKSSWVPLSILTPAALFYIQMKNFKRQKWSAREALQTVKVWSYSEVVTVTVVETPWKYPLRAFVNNYIILYFRSFSSLIIIQHAQCELFMNKPPSSRPYLHMLLLISFITNLNDIFVMKCKKKKTSAQKCGGRIIR